MAISLVAGSTDEDQVIIDSTGVTVHKADMTNLATGDVILFLMTQYTGTGTWTSTETLDMFQARAYTTGPNTDINTAIGLYVVDNLATMPTSFKFNTSVTTEKMLISAAFRGVDNTTPIGVAQSYVESSGDDTPDAGSITPTYSGQMIIAGNCMCTGNTGTGWTSGPPAGMSSAHYWLYASSDSAQAELAYKLASSSTSHPLGSFTGGTGDSITDVVMWTLALNDANGPPASSGGFNGGLWVPGRPLITG